MVALGNDSWGSRAWLFAPTCSSLSATKQKENTTGCTAATYYRRNYQAQIFTVVGEKEHLQLVYLLALKKPLSRRH
jgi:hypothetical protein